MKFYFKLFVILGVFQLSLVTATTAQSLTTTSQPVTLFDTEVQIRIHSRRSVSWSSPITFVSLHNNEQLGLRLTKAALPVGAKLIEVVSVRNGSPKRLLFFRHEERTLCIDPNRIFSSEGIAKSLKDIDTDDDPECQNNMDSGAREVAQSQKVKDEIARFREDLLDIMLPKKSCSPNGASKRQLCSNEVLVAVHNNTDFLSNPTGINAQSFFKLAKGVRDRAIDYLPDGLEYEYSESGYLVNGEDIDDFLMVSNKALFKKLFNEKDDAINFSIGIQKRSPPEKHGYLSAYCGRNSINYIVVEAESNFVAQANERAEQRQKDMLRRIVEVFPSIKR